MTVRFQLSLGDLYHAVFQNIVRKMWFLIPVPVCGIASLVIAALDPSFRDATSSGIPATVFGAFVFAGVPYLQARAAMKNPSFRGPLSFTFSEAGIEAVGDHSSGRMDWTVVKGVLETRQYIFIRLAHGCFQLIPKDQITEADITAVRGILRAYAPGRLKLRR